jgi:hypothetical protein
MSSSSTQSTVSTVAAIGASCLATYYVTNYRRDQRELRERAEAYSAHLERKLAMQEAQKEQGEPVGTLVKELSVEKVYLWEVEQLGVRFPAAGKRKNLMQAQLAPRTNQFFPNLMNSYSGDELETPMATEYNKLIAAHECVLADIVRRPQNGVISTSAYVRAGPREYLHFDPAQVSAAIVTCGGLCPGLNNVVREITNSLTLLYGIGGKVYGIRGGFKGFYDTELPPLILTHEIVENIHHDGGTFLGSSRGGFDLDKILAFIKAKKISQLYVIGGDGTHRGAFVIHEGCIARVRAFFAVHSVPSVCELPLLILLVCLILALIQ